MGEEVEGRKRDWAKLTGSLSPNWPRIGQPPLEGMRLKILQPPQKWPGYKLLPPRWRGSSVGYSTLSRPARHQRVNVRVSGTRLDSAALKLRRTQPFSRRPGALDNQIIKALSLLLDHMSPVTGRGEPMSSLARVPTLWFGRAGAGRLCAKPPMGMVILSKTVSVESYERSEGCCVISRQGVAEPHRGLVGTLLLPAALRAHPSMLHLGPVCLDTSVKVS